MDNKVDFSLIGSDGSPARGGTSKETSDSGECYWQHIGYGQQEDVFEMFSRTPSHFHPPPGKDGASCTSRQKSSTEVEGVVAPRPPFFNDFKAYARENLANNVFELSLRKFSLEVENNKEVQSAYDILSFTNEKLDLENQYWSLRNKLTFRPFYESILNRLAVYEKTLPEANPNRKVLGFLYAAAMSQVNSNIVHQKTIINLRDYLKEAQTHIDEICVVGREVQIQNQQVEYTNSLFSKMNAAKDLMNKRIFPQLDKNLEQIESNFIPLVDETIAKKKQVEEMKKSVIRSSILSGLKIFGTALSFFGPIGMGIGAATGAGTSIAETAFGKQMNSSTITQIFSSLNGVTKALKYNNELLKQQLDDIESEIGSNEKLKDLRSEIWKIKSDVQKADKDESFTGILNARKRLRELTKNKKIDIEKWHPKEITLIVIINKVLLVCRLIFTTKSKTAKRECDKFLMLSNQYRES